jgi:acyl-CoA thioesterase-1
MACRIATKRAACALGAALLSALIGGASARAQSPPAPAASAMPSLLSKACQPGSPAPSEGSPLPNVAAALAQRKVLRILAMGAAPGRVSARGAYTEVIEAMLEGALKGIDVIMINRGVSGELAAGAAHRMRNEVALDEPDLVLWQVGTNDALAYVPVDEFTAVVKEQIEWLKAHKVDLVLVGLQFAPQMRRDAHYVALRDALRKLAGEEKVIVIRFYEAMQILNQATAGEPVVEQFERNEAGFNCLAQYVARAITLGVFAKAMPKPGNKNQ